MQPKLNSHNLYSFTVSSTEVEKKITLPFHHLHVELRNVPTILCLYSCTSNLAHLLKHINYLPLFLCPDVPSGCEIQQLLADIEQANTEVSDLSSYWKDLLNASLETAKKFEADQR